MDTNTVRFIDLHTCTNSQICVRTNTYTYGCHLLLSKTMNTQQFRKKVEDFIWNGKPLFFILYHTHMHIFAHYEYVRNIWRTKHVHMAKSFRFDSIRIFSFCLNDNYTVKIMELFKVILHDICIFLKTLHLKCVALVLSDKITRVHSNIS